MEGKNISEDVRLLENVCDGFLNTLYVRITTSSEIFSDVSKHLLLKDSLYLFQLAIRAIQGRFDVGNLQLKDITQTEARKKHDNMFTRMCDLIQKTTKLVGVTRSKESIDILLNSFNLFLDIALMASVEEEKDLEEIEKELNQLYKKLNEELKKANQVQSQFSSQSQESLQDIYLKIDNNKNRETMPKALIDDWTRVEISLSPILKKEYCDSSCAFYNNSQLSNINGIFFIEAPEIVTIPISSFEEAKELFKNMDKLKEKIKDVIQNNSTQPLLITFDIKNKVIKIYDKFTKAEKLSYPLILDTENAPNCIHVFEMPSVIVNEKIPYELRRELKIYSYTIKFERDIVRFKIYTRNGKAELVYNHNDESVSTVIRYGAYGSWKVELKPHKFYIFIHRRPDWAREEE